MESTAPTKPPMSIKVTINGEEREVFMSFALLNHLVAIIEDVTRLPMIQTDPLVRSIFLTELLHVRTKGGKVTERVEIDDLDMSMDEIQDLLEFASEHVLDFTLGALERAAALQIKSQARMLSLKSTQAGLVASASKNSAA